MKTNFTSIFTKFSAFNKQIVILVDCWELVDEKQKLDSEEALKKIFLKAAKVKGVHFLTSETTQQDLLQIIKQELTGQKGVSLNGTLFDVESPKEALQNAVNIHKAIEDLQKTQKQQIQQDLKQQREKLNSEIVQHAQQIQLNSQQLSEKLIKMNSINLQLNQLQEEFDKLVVTD